MPAPRDGREARQGQDAFVDALLEPDAAVPEDIAPLRDGSPADSRFAVYRNNVMSSLVNALKVTFPTVADLVGDEFFRATAGAFVRQSPPKSPMMMDYGGDFADFLNGFPPAASVPYLADVARLEDARRQAYNARDCAPLPAAAFQSLQSARASRVHLVPHPAARVIRSPFPILSIWRTNHGLRDGVLPQDGEDVLVVRPQFDVEMYLLGPGEARFIAALGTGRALGEAAETAGSDENFDLAAALARLIRAQAICDIRT